MQNMAGVPCRAAPALADRICLLKIFKELNLVVRITF
jgi:hypothetical protein